MGYNEKKIYEKYYNGKRKIRKITILIDSTRVVGKSYMVEEFSKEYYNIFKI